MRILIRDLSPNQAYAFQFRSTDGFGYSDWSRIFNYTTAGDTLAPAPITALSWTVAGTSFLGSWTAPTTNSDGSPLNDLSHYEVTLTNSGTSVIYKVTQPRFDLTFEMNRAAWGTPRASVDISVRAVDTVGNKSTAVTATASNPAPANVTGLVATGAPESIHIKWTANTESDLSHYEVHAQAGADFVPSSTTLIYKGLGTQTTFASTNYTSHTIKVKAFDVFGTGSAAWTNATATPESSFTMDTTPPGVPTAVIVTNGFDATAQRAHVDVSWTAPADTDLQSYIVRYSTSSTSGWSYVSVGADQTSLRLNNLNPGTAYYIGVQAQDFAANESAFANAGTYPITTQADTTIPGQVTGLVLGAGFRSVTARWTESTDADVKNGAGIYEVQLDTANTFNTANLRTNKTSGTITAFTDLTAGTTYYVRVRAIDASGNTGSYSTTASVATATDPATQDYVQSRGMNLVTNGTALLGTNYNFSTTTLDQADKPTGGGSFLTSATGTQTFSIDEFIPVDPNKTYTLLGSFKEKGTPTTPARFYFGIIDYDVDKLSINPYNVMFQAGTTTTLAAALNPGATTVSLTSAANWNNAAGAATYRRGFIFWNYVDSKGYAYPIETYSRNVYYNDMYADGAINFSTNTITLRTAWTGPSIPAGTPVSNSDSGASYHYVAATNAVAPTTWTAFSGTIGGGTAQNSANKFFPGTAYSKVMVLANRNTAGTWETNSRLAFGGISFSEVAAGNLLPSTITSTLIADDAITTPKIAANAVTAAEIAARTITAGLIATDTITSAEIAAAAITANELAANAVTANAIAAGAVTTNKLSVGTLSDSALANGSFEDNNGTVPYNWVLDTTTGYTGATYTLDTTAANVYSGGRSLKMDSTANNGARAYSDAVPTFTGDIWYGSVVLKSSVATSCVLDAYFYDNAGANIGSAAFASFTSTTGFARYEGRVTVPANARYIRVAVAQLSNAATRTTWVDNVELRHASNTTSIADGVITTDKIIATGIEATRLRIQNSPNLVSSQYAGFEWQPSYYDSNIVKENCTATVVTTDKKFETQSLNVTGGGQAITSVRLDHFSNSGSINLAAGTYIISAYVKNSDPNIRTFRFFYVVSPDLTRNYLTANPVKNGATGAAPHSMGASSGWDRYSNTLTLVADTSITLGVEFATTATGSVNTFIDGIQVELQEGAITVPSMWKPPGVTNIVGGSLRTGEIRSTSTIVVNGVSQPAWSINLNGSAQFGSAKVRGNLIIGESVSGVDQDDGQSYVMSGNYQSGVNGWIIKSDGFAELNQGIFRGDVIVGDPLTDRIEINATGLRGYVQTQVGVEADGVTPIWGANETVSLGTAGDDRLRLTDASGTVTASIDAAGLATFREAEIDKIYSPGEIWVNGDLYIPREAKAGRVWTSIDDTGKGIWQDSSNIVISDVEPITPVQPQLWINPSVPYAGPEYALWQFSASYITLPSTEANMASYGTMQYVASSPGVVQLVLTCWAQNTSGAGMFIKPIVSTPDGTVGALSTGTWYMPSVTGIATPTFTTFFEVIDPGTVEIKINGGGTGTTSTRIAYLRVGLLFQPYTKYKKLSVANT